MNEQFNKKQLATLVLWFAKDDGEDCPLGNEAETWANENVKCIEVGDDIVDGKMKYSSNIYQVSEYYFEVTFTCDNTGYWSDCGESYDPEIYEVFPTQVTKTVYVHKKPQ